MYPSTRRRLGRFKVLPVALVALLLSLDRDCTAQQSLGTSTLQTPQIVHFNPQVASVPFSPLPTPHLAPSLLRIPVTVTNDAGQCVQSLEVGDFSLDIDGHESPIELFRKNHATSAA
ncbi:MAG TPA: hypothetical protein VMT64_14015, partial [Candidatus Binataceae bacterium]|nr:hypothetical protein [Candidatus Binataceae bacterium]